MTTNRHGTWFIVVCIGSKLISHLHCMGKLMQAFFDHMRLHQGRLQGNPNYQYKVQGAFHAAIISEQQTRK